MKLKMIMGIMLTFLMVSMFIVLVRETSPLPVIAQANSTATVYLNPPTINGTVIGQEFTINLMIRDTPDIQGWQAGLIFNPDLLECTGFFEGEFLSDIGSTLWIPGTINNTEGVITAHGCLLLGEYYANGSGRLAYLTFKVKAPGVSDLHLQDVKVTSWKGEPPKEEAILTNIIDVYSVVLDTIPNTVVTVSNSTGTEREYGSGFYDHAFSIPAKKISFKITGPYLGFSNVTIPKTLLNVSTLDKWRIVIDGTLLSTEERIITENDTHTSIYFTYSAGIHYVQITTRPLITSIILVTLSSTKVPLGSKVTISGDIDPARLGVTVTVLYRVNVSRWTTLKTLTTDLYSHYSYRWTPETVGEYEFMAMWEGDDNTFGDVSDVKTMTVRSIEDLYYELLENYNNLLADYDNLNSTYYSLLSNYSELQGNYDSLQTSYDNLQASYDQLSSSYTTLQDSYDELQSDQEATTNELSTIRNLMYIFITTTTILIATTVYLAIIKPKMKPESKAT